MISIKRHKLLFVGPSGSGKTNAMFDIAMEVIRAGKQVFWLAFDDGYIRHLPKVDGFFVYHSEPSESSCSDGELFHLWDAGDLIAGRKAYRSAKMMWNKGDWLMMDRLDVLWDQSQSYFIKAHGLAPGLEGVPEIDRDRLSEIEGGSWPIVKDNHNSIAFDSTEGTDARLMRINIAASALAIPGITAWTKRGQEESKASKDDQRKLRNFGITIQGEKNIPGYFETLVVMDRTPQGYIISTDKDRERETFYHQVLDGRKGFWKVYQELLGMELEV